MRIIHLIMLALIVQVTAVAASGRIAEKTSALKAAEKFEKYIPFTVLAGRNPAADESLTDYTLLEVNGVKKILQEENNFIEFTLPLDGMFKQLILFKEDILTDDFSIIASDGRTVKSQKVLHYRGIVEGTGHIAAFTFSDNETMGMIATEMGNFVVGKLNTADGLHVIYNDRNLKSGRNFECTDNAIPEGYMHRNDPPASTQTTKCVRWYWETDYDVYANKGSTSAVNTYMQGIFNQVSTLYANDGISITLQTLYIWNTADPYAGPSTSSYLTQFGNYRTSFNGDLATLIGFQGSGGIAWVNGLCSSQAKYKMAYSGISTTYNTVPTYSWTVEVITHEQGHLLGSKHTHDCAWNGNNTPIDGCGPAAGYTTSCGAGPIPAKGTIMSYCHLLSGVGIDLNLGFGPQPKNLIINNVNNASCLEACSGCAVPAQPATVSGPSSVCPSTTVTYSISPVSTATSYIWTLPSGWSGNSTTTSIQVTTGNNGGTVRVKAVNSCGQSEERTLSVAVSTSVPAQPSSISGSSTVCPSSQVTYSISPVTGATSYIWTLPSGWSGSSSGTSILATSGSSGGTVRVKAVNNCGQSLERTLNVTLSTSAPAQPSSISGSSAVCPGSQVTYSISPVTGATSYIWTLPSGWSGSSSGTSILATTGSSGGTIRVRAVNNCGQSQERTLGVTLSTSAPAQPSTISGTTAVCPGSQVTYSISAVTGATSYQWTLPSGWSGSSTGTSITANAGSSGGTISVKAVNGCGSSIARTLSVSITSSLPTTPGSITVSGGTSKVCPGETRTYATPNANGVSFNWTVPAGANILSGQGSNTITVYYTNNFSASGYVRVAKVNGCGSSPLRSASVIFNKPGTPGSMTGETTGLCNTSGNIYSVPVAAGVTYHWSVPAGVQITSAVTNSNSITVTYPGANILGSITVYASNACGSSAKRSKTVKTMPTTPSSISGNVSVCPNSNANNYSISAVPTATSYTWTAPSGSRITAGSVTSTGNTLTTPATSVSIRYGALTSSSKVSVRANNSCGSGSTKSITLTPLSCRSEIAEKITSFGLFPNPTTGNVTLTIKNYVSSDYEIMLFDMTGKSIYQQSSTFDEGEHALQLPLENFPAGIYLLQVNYGNEKFSKKIEVQ